ncbi:MAG: YtxH domain-containing protein [Vicinamibacterales bacterium]
MFDSSRKSHDSSDGSSGAMIGFTLGLIAGAGLALFMAPATGREARQLVRDKGRRLATNAADRGRDLLKRQGERVSGAVERGYEKAAQLGDRVSEAMDQGVCT